MSHTPDHEAEDRLERGRQLLAQGQPAHAQPLLEQALLIWEQLGDLAAAAQTLQLLAQAALGQHSPGLATSYLRRAVAHTETFHDRQLMADLHADLGAVAASIGETEDAISFYTQARQIYCDLLMPQGEGGALYAMGKVLQEAGRMPAAIPLFQQAFPLLRSTPSWNDELAMMERLVATVALAQGVFAAGNAAPRRAFAAMRSAVQEQASAGSPVAAELQAAIEALMPGVVAALQSPPPLTRRQQMLAALHDPEPTQRAQALRDLTRLTPPEGVAAIFALLLAERDATVLMQAVKTVQCYGDPALRARLRPLLAHPEPVVRAALAVGLAAIDEPVPTALLVEGLQAADPHLRAAAVQALERRKDPSTGDALLPLLQDPDRTVRTKAIYALGALRERRAIPQLMQATTDRYQTVRWAAVRVLGDLRASEAFAVLISRLDDSSRDVRRSAATSLGKLKDPRAVEGLTGALTDPWFRVCESAHKALRALKASPSIAILQGQLAHPDAVRRRAAAELLQNYAPAAAQAALHAQLAEPDIWARMAAVRALAKGQDRAAVPLLITLLHEPNPMLQMVIIEALGVLQDERAEPVLIALLRSDNPYIRVACIDALQLFGTRESLPALALIQLRDEDSVNRNGGMDFVTLRTVAATAIRAIRARHGLSSTE